MISILLAFFSDNGNFEFSCMALIEVVKYLWMFPGEFYERQAPEDVTSDLLQCIVM